MRVTLTLAALAGTLLPRGAWAAEPQADVRLESYARPSGETCFALSLSAELEPSNDAPHDIVVLFDTSASQTGRYREKSLEVLRNFLATLGPKDRVQLLAVDLHAVPMTDSFVTAGGNEMNAALAKLAQRAPLGLPLRSSCTSVRRRGATPGKALPGVFEYTKMES